MIAVAERLDFIDHAVDEADLPHQLVGAEVVGPDFDRNLDVAVAVGVVAPAGGEGRTTLDVVRLDVGRLAAVVAHFRAGITLCNEPAAATETVGAGRHCECQQQGSESAGDESAHGRDYACGGLNCQ